jgi:hypothetical protein
MKQTEAVLSLCGLMLGFVLGVTCPIRVPLHPDNFQVARIVEARPCEYIEYSIGPIAHQDGAWRQWNGPENSWCQVDFSKPGKSFFCGSIGPLKMRDAEQYIRECLQGNPMAIWKH